MALLYYGLAVGRVSVVAPVTAVCSITIPVLVAMVLGERPGYYAHSAMYACPTTKASFGITLLESMACETPVVCSDIYGFRDVVKHEREALMVHCGDTEALADSLVRLLDDETLRARLGKRGRQEAESRADLGG